MCVACFNTRGTLIHHKTKKPVPLMPHLLRRLQEAGWQIRVTTRSGADAAEELLCPVYREAKIPPKSIKIAADLTDKAKYVRCLIDGGATDVVFVDDNPTQVESVQKFGQGRRDAVVRVFGFLGSIRVPKAYARCVNAGAKRAMTAIDLSEQLESWFSYESVLPTLSFDDVIELIPGLQHPMSTAGGESQLVPGFIFARWTDLSADQLNRVWMNVGLVQCDRCMWYLIVRLALTESGHPRFLAALEGAHDVEKCMLALKEALPTVHNLGRRLNNGLDLMLAGVKSIGANGIADIEGRIAMNKQRVQELLGGF